MLFRSIETFDVNEFDQYLPPNGHPGGAGHARPGHLHGQLRREQHGGQPGRRGPRVDVQAAGAAAAAPAAAAAAAAAAGPAAGAPAAAAFQGLSILSWNRVNHWHASCFLKSLGLVLEGPYHLSQSSSF